MASQYHRPTTPDHMKQPPPGMTADSASNRQARMRRLSELLGKSAEERKISASVADRHRRFQPLPPNSTPADLFHAALNCCTVPAYRFIRNSDIGQMLMFCDGACLNNGRLNPKGGCGVVVAPSCNDTSVNISGTGIEHPLENTGVIHTNNRAELRSAILGLGLRYWRGEGFERIVVAMDSEYVVLGITEWIHTWIANGWKTSAGNPVANQDLWETLLVKLRDLERQGMHAQFWRIPRELNMADKYAKLGAAKNEGNRESRLMSVNMIEF